MIIAALEPITTAELWAMLKSLIEAGMDEESDLVKRLGLEIYERLEGLKG